MDKVYFFAFNNMLTKYLDCLDEIKTNLKCSDHVKDKIKCSQNSLILLAKNTKQNLWLFDRKIISWGCFLFGH